MADDQYAELRDTLQRLRDADTSGQIREAIESYRMTVLPGIVGALLAERDALLGALRDYVAADEPWVERGYGVGGEVMERARAAIERAEGGEA